MAEFFEQLKTTTGLSRLDYRWGFDDDALMSVTRLVAPAPHKPALAIFDQPPLDTKNLIPMPEGVESFVMLSLSPAKALEAVSQIGPAGEVKEQIDELMEKVRSQSRIDFDKDFLSNLGPRMAIYLEPGRSAAATDEAPQTPAGLAGLDPMAMLASLQGALPKPTLVAELRDPVTFGKALDSIMLIVNKELKAQAMEKAAEDGAADEAGQGPAQARGPGRGLGGAAGPGGRPAQAEPQRHARARVSPHARQCQDLHAERSHRFAAEDPPAGSAPDNPDGGEPHRLLADLRGGARPSTRSRRRDGNPDRTSSRRLPPPSRADLPGGRRPERDRAQPPGQPAGNAPGPDQLGDRPVGRRLARRPSRRYGARTARCRPRLRPGWVGAWRWGPGGPRGGRFFSMPGMSGRPGFPGGSGSAAMSGRPGFPGGSGPPGAPAPNTSAAEGGSQDAMIQLKVDAAKLPKAEELKALMFPSTLAVVVDDTSIRLVSRESFPNVVSGLGMGAAFAGGFVPAFNAARARALAAAGVPPGQAAPAPAPGNPPAAAQPPAAGAGPARMGGPRGPGRGGRPGGGGRPG